MKSSQLRNKFAQRRLLTQDAVLVFVTILCLSLAISVSDVRMTDAQTKKPLDLTSELEDANGFLVDPKWAWQEVNKGNVPNPNDLCFNNPRKQFAGCTNDNVSLDRPQLYKVHRQTCRFTRGTVNGHVNWPRAVTYTARICWNNFSFDGDYCFELAPREKNGLTANRDTLHAEFNAAETIKHFASPWWTDFREHVGMRAVAGIGVGERETNFAKKFINNKRAVIIGMFNLDCVHDCYTEVHPVYAIAINTKADTLKDGFVEETWALLARNWGNEGWCSSKQHYLDTESNKITLMLPWGPDKRAGKTASSFEVIEEGSVFNLRYEGPAPEVSPVGNQGVQVTFFLRNPIEKQRIHGELRLRWKMPEAFSEEAPSEDYPSVSRCESGYEMEEEQLFEALGERRRRRIANQPKAGVPDSVVRKVVVKNESARTRTLSILDQNTGLQKVLVRPLAPTKPPQIRSKFDGRKARRDRDLLGLPSPQRRRLRRN